MLVSPLPFLLTPTRARPKTAKSTAGFAVPLLLESERNCEYYVTTGTRSNFHLLPSRNGSVRTAMSYCTVDQEIPFLLKLLAFLSTLPESNPTITKGSVVCPIDEKERYQKEYPGWPVFPVPEGTPAFLFAPPLDVGTYTRIGDHLSVQIWDPSLTLRRLT